MLGHERLSCVIAVKRTSLGANNIVCDRKYVTLLLAKEAMSKDIHLAWAEPTHCPNLLARDEFAAKQKDQEGKKVPSSL